MFAISFCRIKPFINVECPSLSLVNFFDLKSILPDISLATPALFGVFFAGNTLFHPFTFNLSVSLDLSEPLADSIEVGHVFLSILLGFSKA